jgi:hypothetical protein
MQELQRWYPQLQLGTAGLRGGQVIQAEGPGSGSGGGSSSSSSKIAATVTTFTTSGSTSTSTATFTTAKASAVISTRSIQAAAVDTSSTAAAPTASTSHSSGCVGSAGRRGLRIGAGGATSCGTAARPVSGRTGRCTARVAESFGDREQGPLLLRLLLLMLQPLLRVARSNCQVGADVFAGTSRASIPLVCSCPRLHAPEVAGGGKGVETFGLSGRCDEIMYVR